MTTPSTALLSTLKTGRMVHSDHEKEDSLQISRHPPASSSSPPQPSRTVSSPRHRTRSHRHRTRRERSISPRDKRGRRDRLGNSRSRSGGDSGSPSRSPSGSCHSRSPSGSREDRLTRGVLSGKDEQEELREDPLDRGRGQKRSRNGPEIIETVTEETQTHPYPKKKKEYKATSSFVGDDEFEDILERGWFYVDSNGDKQGPFTTKEMKEWYVAGFFNNELLVKRISDPGFGKISEREEFAHLERKPSLQVYTVGNTYEQGLEMESAQNPYYQDFPAVYDPSFEQETGGQEGQGIEGLGPEDMTAYTQAAFFTTLGGRFAVGDQASYWKKKGLPTDKDGRMLSHYFDVDAYQEQMRNSGPPKKKKVTKNMIKYYKRRKEDRKRRRALL